MASPSLSFEIWKTLLRADCIRADKLLVYENLGEVCLQALWEAGIEPSVEDISNIQSEHKVA